MLRDLSYETDSGPKTKTDEMTFLGDADDDGAPTIFLPDQTPFHCAQG